MATSCGPLPGPLKIFVSGASLVRERNSFTPKLSYEQMSATQVFYQQKSVIMKPYLVGHLRLYTSYELFITRRVLDIIWCHRSLRWFLCLVLVAIIVEKADSHSYVYVDTAGKSAWRAFSAVVWEKLEWLRCPRWRRPCAAVACLPLLLDIDACNGQRRSWLVVHYTYRINRSYSIACILTLRCWYELNRSLVDGIW